MGNFITRYRQESIWDRRGAMAFAVAPMAPVLAYSVVTTENFLGSMMLGAMIAYGYMLGFGLTVVALLNWCRKISLLTSAFGAALIAVVPWAVFLGSSVLRGHGPVGPSAIVAMLMSCCFFGGCGGIAGITWWFIACYKKGPVTV